MQQEGKAALEARYRARSLWLDGLESSLAPRPSLPGDVECDVAIVGAGFTGLWAAYHLARARRDMRIVVCEREIAGFGPSGRNGGWVSGGLIGSADAYAREAGRDAVLRAYRETLCGRRPRRRGRRARGHRLRLPQGRLAVRRDDEAAAGASAGPPA
jgi:glycine/D-amino acid oxidase-like deaminating enzyme